MSSTTLIQTGVFFQYPERDRIVAEFERRIKDFESKLVAAHIDSDYSNERLEPIKIGIHQIRLDMDKAPAKVPATSTCGRYIRSLDVRSSLGHLISREIDIAKWVQCMIDSEVLYPELQSRTHDLIDRHSPHDIEDESAFFGQFVYGAPPLTIEDLKDLNN